MRAGKLYPVLFSSANLLTLYEQKVSKSGAVGRDGVKRPQFKTILEQEVDLIARKVEEQSYRFTAYKQKLVSKGPNKYPREISIPTIRDRITLRTLCDLLAEVFFESKTQHTHKYIKAIGRLTKRVDKDTYGFLRIDVERFYPSINQELLLKKVRHRIRKPQLVSLIEKSIKTPTGKSNIDGNESLDGVPQGLSISNILASLYLQKFDQKHEKNKDYHYFRYVDDILIIAPLIDCNAIYETIKKDLKQLSLSCHPLEANPSGKTAILPLGKGIDYLGFNATPSQISVRRSSYKKMFVNITRAVTQYKYAQELELFIWKLNLKITGCIFEEKRYGWMHFFSQTENKSQLVRLDHFVNKITAKLNIGNRVADIKKFIKTYHEIRFNPDNTTYIPNFDIYTLAEKKNLIVLLSKYNIREVQTWNVALIENQFTKLTHKEISELEKDVLEVFS